MQQRSFEEISKDIDRLLASVSPIKTTDSSGKNPRLIKINTWSNNTALA